MDSLKITLIQNKLVFVDSYLNSSYYSPMEESKVNPLLSIEDVLDELPNFCKPIEYKVKTDSLLFHNTHLYIGTAKGLS